MNREEVERRVIEIVAEELGVEVENILLRSRIDEDLSADSHDTIDLFLEVEEFFDLSYIRDEESEKIHPVGQLIDWVCGRFEIG